MFILCSTLIAPVFITKIYYSQGLIYLHGAIVKVWGSGGGRGGLHASCLPRGLALYYIVMIMHARSRARARVYSYVWNSGLY